MVRARIRGSQEELPMSHRPLFAFLAAVIICLVCVKQAKADPITLTLTNPNQVGTPGSTLVYSGIITNAGPASVSVTGAGMTYAGGALFGNFLFTGTFAGSLPFTLAPGQSTGEIALATFTFLPSYDGPFPATEFVVLGISVNSVNSEVASQTFTATAVAPQTVPEPVTVLLFGTGLAALAARARGKRRDRTKTHA